MILKFTLRILYKRPLLNLMKVLGLSLALSGLLIISLFLKNELSFDHLHKNWNRIYRYSLTSKDFFGGKHFARVYNTSYIPHMQEYFPEIKSYVRLAPVRGGFIKYNDKFIDVNQAFECDSTFFKIFDASLIAGNPEYILNNPGSLIISEKFAKKTFGEENPVGKVITLPGGQFYNEKTNFTVRGIMKDFPCNMHFHPDFIVSPVNKSVFDRWAWVYLLLKENADPENIKSKFKTFIASTSDEKESEINMDAHLQNISDIHLNSHKLREIESNGNMTVVYTLAIAVLLLLFIALINYTNLNIGMAGFSDKFLYVSKISGATNWIGFKYALYEGIIITLLTLITSIAMVGLANNLILKYFGLNIFAHNLMIVSSIALIFILLSILSGILPVFRNAFGKVNSILNKRGQNNVGKRSISKGLIILQYTISIALITAVIIIHRQTRYALNSSMGLNSHNLICLENLHTEVQSKFTLFKDELMKFSSIESVSAMFEPPGGEANDMFRFEMKGFTPDESDNLSNMIKIFPCDYSFASIFGLNFLSGQNFSENYEDNEGSGEYIINESAVIRLGYSDSDKIIGKEFKLNFIYGGINIPRGKIIGVVKDFHFSSLKKKIEPLVLFKRKGIWISNFIISFAEGNRNKALRDLETLWGKLFTNHPFQYTFVDSMYKSVYKSELMQAKLLSIFTFVALFICSMGLLGMSLLVTQRKTKEIGIRKVNGAKVSNIVFMLNWNLIRWIIISFVISIPLAYYAMNRWLENFAYKIKMNWWIFGIAGLLAIIISILTVSVISWNAARNNPVNALRYE